jgi:electron transfer DM13
LIFFPQIGAFIVSRNIAIGFILLIVIVVGAAITRPWTYFVTVEVDDAFPEVSTNTETDNLEVVASNTPQELIVPTEAQEASEARAIATANIAPPVVEPTETLIIEPTVVEPIALLRGSFIEIDPVHGASGTATIYSLADNSRILRFEDFQSTNGPELHVILSKETPSSTLGSIGSDYVDLGLLRGNVGNQNYDIPTDLDLSQFRSVVIYCVPFGVVFSSATLN